MSKYCGRCGVRLDDNMVFCPSCGFNTSQTPINIQNNNNGTQKNYVNPNVPPIPPPQQYRQNHTNISGSNYTNMPSSIPKRTTAHTPVQNQESVRMPVSRNFNNETAVLNPESQMPIFRQDDDENIPYLSMAEEVNHAKPKKDKKFMSKGKIIAIILSFIAVIIISVAVAAVILYLFGSAGKTVDNMDAQNYSEALSEYETEVKDDFIQKAFLNIRLNGYADKILEKFQNGEIDYGSAMEALGALESMDIEVPDKIFGEIEALNKSNGLLSQADEYFKSGDYANAILTLKDISESDINFDAAQEKLAEICSKYIDTVKENVNNLANEGNYPEAFVCIDKALETIPEGVDSYALTDLRTDLLDNYKKLVISSIDSLLENKKYTNALQEIYKALAVDNNSDFQAEKDKVAKLFVDYIENAVDIFIEKKEYEKAEDLVDNSLIVLPNNSDLESLKQRIIDEKQSQR